MKRERESIDPEGRYPSEGDRLVEWNARRVLDLVGPASVERTESAIEVRQLGEFGIVVLVTAEAIELRLPTVEWTMGAYGPASASRLWRRVEAEGLTDSQLVDLLTEAQEARATEFSKCRYCGELVPAEHRIDEDVCHGCASSHLGVVF